MNLDFDEQAKKQQGMPLTLISQTEQTPSQQPQHLRMLVGRLNASDRQWRGAGVCLLLKLGKLNASDKVHTDAELRSSV
eukprot:898847-Pelagomonas_calceolata.AAC.1